MKNQNRADHTIAITVPCRYCGAKPNQSCINKITGRPLYNFAAHQHRITDSRKTLRLVDDDEVIF